MAWHDSHHILLLLLLLLRCAAAAAAGLLRCDADRDNENRTTQDRVSTAPCGLWTAPRSFPLRRGTRPDPSPRESFPKLRSPSVIILSLSTSTRGSFAHPPSTQGMHACCGYLYYGNYLEQAGLSQGWLDGSFRRSTPRPAAGGLHSTNGARGRMEARKWKPEQNQNGQNLVQVTRVWAWRARGEHQMPARSILSLVASLACVGKTNSQPHTNACPPALPLQKKKALVPAW